MNLREYKMQLLLKASKDVKRFGYMKDDYLLEVLTNLFCPPPCVGYVNEAGWHNLCIAKATAALSAVRKM